MYLWNFLCSFPFCSGANEDMWYKSLKSHTPSLCSFLFSDFKCWNAALLNKAPGSEIASDVSYIEGESQSVISLQNCLLYQLFPFHYVSSCADRVYLNFELFAATICVYYYFRSVVQKFFHRTTRIINLITTTVLTIIIINKKT